MLEQKKIGQITISIHDHERFLERWTFPVETLMNLIEREGCVALYSQTASFVDPDGNHFASLTVAVEEE